MSMYTARLHDEPLFDGDQYTSAELALEIKDAIEDGTIDMNDVDEIAVSKTAEATVSIDITVEVSIY